MSRLKTPRLHDGPCPIDIHPNSYRGRLWSGWLAGQEMEVERWECSGVHGQWLVADDLLVRPPRAHGASKLITRVGLHVGFSRLVQVSEGMGKQWAHVGDSTLERTPAKGIRDVAWAAAYRLAGYLLGETRQIGGLEKSLTNAHSAEGWREWLAQLGWRTRVTFAGQVIATMALKLADPGPWRRWERFLRPGYRGITTVLGIDSAKTRGRKWPASATGLLAEGDTGMGGWLTAEGEPYRLVQVLEEHGIAWRDGSLSIEEWQAALAAR